MKFSTTIFLAFFFAETQCAIKDERTNTIKDQLKEFCDTKPESVDGTNCGSLKGAFSKAILAAAGFGGKECERTKIANQFVNAFPAFDQQLAANMCVTPVNQVFNVPAEIPCTSEKFIGNATPSFGEFGKVVQNNGEGAAPVGAVGPSSNSKKKDNSVNNETSGASQTRAEKKAAKKAKKASKQEKK
ncbi:hypothetical protein HK099_007784 [Clydaea vesicula]|uniref:Uncharacterized protein n=1 Tax=Clydaea vesicula TaxID=447962 RepID=A0AAD5U8V7_9FUNG|nr:hypothetical protein HK099_007784 [Clydaea vesicula]